MTRPRWWNLLSKHRHKRAAVAAPVSLADRRRLSDAEIHRRAFDKIGEDLRAELFASVLRDGTPAEFDGLLGDDGSPSMLEGGR